MTPDAGPSRPRGRETRRSSVRRALRGAVGVVVVGAVAAGGLLAWVTAFPRTNPASRVDALLVPATQPGAHQEAARLAEAGVTDLLLVSTPPEVPTGLCHDPPVGTEVVCFAPDPKSTQGEAMAGTRIAREHGVETLGVLTFDHHVERSRLLVERCWDGPVHLYEFEPRRGTAGKVYDFVYAMGAYGKAFITPGCDTQLPRWLEAPLERAK